MSDRPGRRAKHSADVTDVPASKDREPLPGALRRWVESTVGAVEEVQPLSFSNNPVWLVRAGGSRYVAKHMRDTSSDAILEQRLLTALAGSSLFRPITAVHPLSGREAFVLAPYLEGRSLDRALADGCCTPDHAERWAEEWAAVMAALASIPVRGYGRSPLDLQASWTTWSGFLHAYLAEQREKGPQLAAERHAQVAALLAAVADELDRAVPAPVLIPGDSNNRNFLVRHDGSLTCMNLPVMWQGDFAKPYGEAMVHGDQTLLAERVRERAAAAGIDAWRLHFYAAYHAYVVLAYAERFAPEPLQAVAPWGRVRPLLEILDEHLDAAWRSFSDSSHGRV
jgi:hypothetical protein